jgi:hypothetical protein
MWKGKQNKYITAASTAIGVGAVMVACKERRCDFRSRIYITTKTYFNIRLPIHKTV